jgi:FkbM family methyltransferase
MLHAKIKLELSVTRMESSSVPHDGLIDEEMNPRRLPFAVVVPTVYGQILVNRHDINQMDSLLKNGVAPDHDEIRMLAALLRCKKPDRVVIDVGASFGTYSLALAAVVGPRGKVHAFEPQRIIYNMLAGSVALNSLTNVYCYNAAVGDREGVIDAPQFDYSMPLNFGGVEFGPEQVEELTQIRKHDPDVAEQVHLTTLDGLGLERVDLIKLDVEGMEMEVLSGALSTIGRFRPILYVEFLKSDSEALRARLNDLAYEVFPTGINYLSIPAEDIYLVALARRASGQIREVPTCKCNMSL